MLPLQLILLQCVLPLVYEQQQTCVPLQSGQYAFNLLGSPTFCYGTGQTNYGNPQGSNLISDPNGNVYCGGSGSIAQWNSQGSYNQLWYSISNAYNLALDPTNGNMYVTSTQAGNNIVKIQIVNGVATGSNVWLSSITAPFAITVDYQGNVWFMNWGGITLWKYSSTVFN